MARYGAQPDFDLRLLKGIGNAPVPLHHHHHHRRPGHGHRLHQQKSHQHLNQLVGVGQNVAEEESDRSKGSPITSLVEHAHANALPPVAVAAALREIGVALAAVSQALTEEHALEGMNVDNEDEDTAVTTAARPWDEHDERRPAGAGADAAARALAAASPAEFDVHVADSLRAFYQMHAPGLLATVPQQVAALEHNPANFTVMCDILEQSHGASPLTSARAAAKFNNNQNEAIDSSSDSDGSSSDSSSEESASQFPLAAGGDVPRERDRESVADLLSEALTEFYEEHDPKMVPHVDEIVVCTYCSVDLVLRKVPL